MKNAARTTLPIALSTTVGLSAVTVMFVLPGEAAPVPTTFSADVSGEVWRVNSLDLDMSGDPVAVDVAVARAQGLLASAASPDRARAVAQNLVADPAPSGLTKAESVATQSQDTAGTKIVNGAAGTIAQVLDFATSKLTASGRWGGDTSCLTASTPLTASTSTSQGSGIVPAAIPNGTPPSPLDLIPDEVPIPPELLPELPSDWPTELPSNLPLPTITLPVPTPTLPSPSITLPVPTPTLPSPTITPPFPRTDSTSTAAEGDVSMARVAGASIEEKSQLQAIGNTTSRRVYAETIGKLTDPGLPFATFFGGEVELRMMEAPRLTAYSDGGANGSQVDWTPPVMTLTVGGTAYEVPTNDTALSLPYSKNEDVVLTVSAGELQRAESAQGVEARGQVTTLDVLIKNGESVVLNADLFPMSVKAVAPSGGVDCTPIEVPEPSKPGLKLKGKDNGKKDDKPVANAVTNAAGAKATLYKVVNGKKKKVAAGKLNKRGDRAFEVKDKNGKKRTTYLVKITRTELTTAGKASKKVR